MNEKLNALFARIKQLEDEVLVEEVRRDFEDVKKS